VPSTALPLTVDPLDRLTRRQLIRLARRAARAARRPGGHLQRLARRSCVDVRRLRLLADAWEEAGASGIVALGPAPRENDVAAMRRMDGALEAWRRRHYPLEALRWDVWRNRVTVWHLVPGRDRRGDLDRRALAHLRLTPDGRWHLYRKETQGEWWPVVVVGPRAHQDMFSCLDALRVDADSAFWSAEPQGYEGSEFWFGPDRYRN
jgi:hypothetical protein